MLQLNVLPQTAILTVGDAVVVGGAGLSYNIGHGLKIEAGNTLVVDSVSDFEGDNTLPATAALVQNTVGNIEILLGTI